MNKYYNNRYAQDLNQHPSQPQSSHLSIYAEKKADFKYVKLILKLEKKQFRTVISFEMRENKLDGADFTVEN